MVKMNAVPRQQPIPIEPQMMINISTEYNEQEERERQAALGDEERQAEILRLNE